MRNSFITIRDFRIDLYALLRLHHEYNPAACSAVNCCCGSYEVTVGRKELKRLVGMIPESSRHARHLRDEDGEFENPFEPVGGGLYALDTDAHGRCVFAFRDKEGAVRCSIHTAALRLGLEPFTTKPFSCSLWPMALSEDDPPILTVQEDAYRFPCNRRLDAPAAQLAPEIAMTIEKLFGADFLAELNERIAARAR